MPRKMLHRHGKIGSATHLMGLQLQQVLGPANHFDVGAVKNYTLTQFCAHVIVFALLEVRLAHHDVPENAMGYLVGGLQRHRRSKTKIWGISEV